MGTPSLGYCLNVHPGETLDEVIAVIAGPVARARALLGVPELHVGLWLAAPAARAVASEPGARERLEAALSAAGARPFTANAFPIGGFHGERVGRAVYRPTWAEPSRASYTLDVARSLAALLPDGAQGSISTSPVSYSAFGDGEAELDRAGAELGRVAAELERLEAETGRSLALALEPEPLATLEVAGDAVRFLEARVFSGAGREAFERTRGPSSARADDVLRRRVGVCLDACHEAVAFEPIEAALATYRRAGVRVAKAQLSSALAVERPRENAAGVERLRAFDEPRYLHQTFARRPDGALERVEDIGAAFEGDRLRPAFRDAAEVRSHFHVPLAWPGGDGLATTRAWLEAGLAGLAAATPHLEVETYTWGVLPEATRARFSGDVAAMVAAELAWAREALRKADFSAKNDVGD